MEEDAKTSFILKQVDQSDLNKSIEALKDQMATKHSGTVSYTTSENHLMAAVSELPE